MNVNGFEVNYLIETSLAPALVVEVMAGGQSCGIFPCLQGEPDELRLRGRHGEID